MLYKFKSQATGDLIMLEPQARRLLGIIGKEPSARGIIEPAQMSAAIAALEHAVAQEEALLQANKTQVAHTAEHPGEAQLDSEAQQAAAEHRVSLRQRAAPLVAMLRRCQAEDKAMVWGV